MTFHDSLTDISDPEVVPKAKRRQFSAQYKVRILEEAGDGVRQGDKVGRHLRVDLRGHPLDPAGQPGQVAGPLLAGP